MNPDGLGFDDNGCPLPAVGFKYPDDDDSSDVRLAALETARDQAALIMAHIVDSRSLETAGRRALVLGWVLGELPAIRSQRGLAALLRCSPAAVTKLTQNARAFLRKSGKRGATG